MSVKIDDDSLFDTTALANALKITGKTARQMLAAKKIKAKKLGKKWYVTGTSLKEYFNQINSDSNKE